eukprot:TRINITY_DN835_c0_g2_i1.p1 TRINITY_DN835_c0_g2~~TRINITY_DN835_c0_g2_i1.p1  ORF type:complete len:743 (+),score=90.67 TRINITY_DN835_c0_g2_i1:94-2322(+)
MSTNKSVTHNITHTHLLHTQTLLHMPQHSCRTAQVSNAITLASSSSWTTIVLAAAVVLVAVLDIGTVQVAHGAQLPNGTLNIWNPGARCLHRDDPATLLTRICSGWIDSEWIYVDDYQQQRLSKIEERVVAVASKNPCVYQQYRVYCAIFYRPCLEVEVPGYGQVAVGQLLCETMFDLRYELCYAQYLTFGLSVATTNYILNSTVPWPYDFGYYNDVMIYQPANYTLNITVTNATASYTGEVFFPMCFDKNKNALGDINKIYCTQGTYSDGDTACAFNCPQPLITDDEYRAADIMLYIVGWLGFVLSAFVVVSYLISARSKLVFPSTLTFFFVCCVMCISFVFVLGSFVQQENMRCADKHTPNLWGDGWCTVQGVTYVYFTLAGALWWLSIGINLFVTIAFGYKPQERRLCSAVLKSHHREVMHSDLIQAVLHAVCWGIPLIVVIIGLGSHKIGYNPSDFWCTLHSGEEIRFVLGEDAPFPRLTGDTDVTKVDLWNLLLLTIPIFCITLIGTVILILVFVIGWIKSRQGLRFLRDQWRLLLLMFLYLYVYSFVFGYRVKLTVDRQAQYEEFLDFINCQKANAGNQEVCQLSSIVVYPLWIISAFNVAGQGIAVFLIYGTSRGVAKSWGRFFRLCGINIPKTSSYSHSASSGSTSSGRKPGAKITGTKILTASQSMADEISADEEGTDNASAYESDQEMDYIGRRPRDDQSDTTNVASDEETETEAVAEAEADAGEDDTTQRI